MKKLILLSLLIIATRVCSAQTTVVSGNVKNEQGNPVHYAFVKDDKLSNAIYTDTLGSFSLAVNPASKLTITCIGYNDATVDVAGHTNVQVVLKSGGTAETTVASGDAKLLQAAFINANADTRGSGVGFGGAPVFSDAKQVVGHRFLFTQWVHGYMVKADGSFVQSPAYLFNYDKMKGDVYVTENLGSVTLGDKNVIKAFTLYYHDQIFSFEKMTGISADYYSQVLSAGARYKIYKLTTTKFEKSNYDTNGITASGSSSDEYVDNNAYYVLNLKTNAFQPFALKKKAIKTAFADDADKVNTFITAHASDKLDDDYLKALGDTLNQ